MLILWHVYHILEKNYNIFTKWFKAVTDQCDLIVEINKKAKLYVCFTYKKLAKRLEDKIENFSAV